MILAAFLFAIGVLIFQEFPTIGAIYLVAGISVVVLVVKDIKERQ